MVQESFVHEFYESVTSYIVLGIIFDIFHAHSFNLTFLYWEWNKFKSLLTILFMKVWKIVKVTWPRLTKVVENIQGTKRFQLKEAPMYIVYAWSFSGETCQTVLSWKFSASNSSFWMMFNSALVQNKTCARQEWWEASDFFNFRLECNTRERWLGEVFFASSSLLKKVCKSSWPNNILIV